MLLKSRPRSSMEATGADALSQLCEAQMLIHEVDPDAVVLYRDDVIRINEQLTLGAMYYERLIGVKPWTTLNREGWKNRWSCAIEDAEPEPLPDWPEGWFPL